MTESFIDKTVKYHRRSNRSKLGFLESEIVGRTATWEAPLGERRILFCDHATSSRALRFVEKFIYGRIFPYYVHEETECTATGRYTSSSVADARYLKLTTPVNLIPLLFVLDMKSGILRMQMIAMQCCSWVMEAQVQSTVSSTSWI